jgi:predicted ribosome quality control (RQC) complex YloA/Tae2 family protein
VVAFRENLEAFQQELTKATNNLQEQLQKIEALQTALYRANEEAPQLSERINDVRMQLLEINEEMNGSEAKNEVGVGNPPSPRSRVFVGYRALRGTYGPTQMHREAIKIGKEELDEFEQKLSRITDEIMPELEHGVEDAGAPPIEGING